MSLRLICGKAGTGKSNFCFEEIKEKIKNKEKIYMITPEQFSFTAEEKLLEKLEVGSCLQAEVLTFARMAYRVIQEVGEITNAMLSKSGQAMLICDILEKEKKNLNFLGKSNQNIDLVQTQLTELKKHAISLEMLNTSMQNIENRYLQEKLKDIITIYEKHQDRLKGKYIEENDRLEILASQLSKTKIFENAIIYIDEFTGFTKQEYKIIEELLKTAKQISITITTDNLDMQTSIENDIFYSNKQTADKLLYIARKNKIDCEKTIFLENAYRFKTEELKHLEENLGIIPYKVYQKQVKNISLYLAKNPYSEIEYVAKEIYALVKNKNYRFKDIAVMTKQIENYGSLCKAIFKNYDIPLFLDEKKELNQNEFAKFILALLEVYAQSWSYEAVIGYIKTGFIDISNEEMYEFENFCKKWGIKGSKWYKSEWNFGRKDEDEKEQIKRMQDIRERLINPLVKLKQILLGTKRVGQMNEALYQFLLENNIKDKIIQNQIKLDEQGKQEIAKEQEDVWNIVINLFDEMNELFKEDTITFERYRELLKIGLLQAPLGKIPQAQDQVIVGTLDRTRTHKVKVVFVIGMNDGIFPSIQKNEGFLNDSDRNILKENGVELAKGTLENLYEDNLNIYKALTTAEEKIYFSYPSANLDGGALRTSTYIMKIKKQFPKLYEKSELTNENIVENLNENVAFEELAKNLRKKQDGEKISETWNYIEAYFNQKIEWKEKLKNIKGALAYNNEPEIITKENVQKLYGNTIVTSISRLEQYKSCPFSYYLKYGLKLKPSEEYKIQNIDTGTFMHEVIDEFFKLLRQRELSIKQLENEQIRKLVEEIIDEKLGLSKYYIFTSSDRFTILTNKLKRVVMQSMKYLIEGLKNSDFEVFANELEFKKGEKYPPITINLENGKKVEITGKIDRIDIAKTSNNKYIRIIDYKSSVKNIDLNQFVAGLQIQLLTYLDAACKIEEVLPAGVLYYNLIDPILKTERRIDKEQIEEEMKKKFKMNGLVLLDVNVIKMMDRSLEKGSSATIPVYLDKQGNISQSKSSVVTKEQFEDLRKYTNKLIKEIAEEMLKGKISIEPYYQKKNQKTPCDYCEYKNICNFKEYGCNNYRYIANDKKEDILEKISH